MWQTKPEREQKEETNQSRWGFRGMTVRDWLPIGGTLLIPVVVAAGTWGITWQQGKIEDRRAKAERELAEQRAQDEALQAYLDQMNTLLLEHNLRNSKEDSGVRTLARARTLTVLGRLDPDWKTEIMRFLVEAELVQGVEIGKSQLTPMGYLQTEEERDPIISLGTPESIIGGTGLKGGVDLHGTDLRGLELKGSNLTNADLTHANLYAGSLEDARLSNADLSNTELGNADLRKADLSTATLHSANLDYADLESAFVYGVDLSNANLIGAKLIGANLFSADLRDADMSSGELGGADLTEANLRGADLSGTDLSYADLTDANLRDATGVTDKQLAKVKSLKGATMPDGQKYEEWIKDREGRKEDGKDG